MARADASPTVGVLRLTRRTPPRLPIEVFGPVWALWISTAAEAAACPPNYVAAPLLASASVLIGHARWGQATPGWAEPPHLWVAAVADNRNGNTPAPPSLLRHALLDRGLWRAAVPRRAAKAP